MRPPVTQRILFFGVLVLLLAALPWLVCQQKPLPGDPNSLKEGSIRGNRDGTPGQQLK